MPSLDAILRANPDYVDSLYRKWLEDPGSVDRSWALFFEGMRYAGNGGSRPAARADGGAEPILLTARGALPEGIEEETVEPGLRIYDVVYTYRAFGHLIADLDPLGHRSREHPLLALSEFGFTEDDLDIEVRCPIYKDIQEGTLGEFLESLRETYCRTIGIEYMELTDPAPREWLQERMEPVQNHAELSAERRREILRELVAADTFEETIHRRFPGAKRFSLEGGTTLIPMLKTMVEEAAGAEVEEIVMGMAHRGRLNVLAHVLGKPYSRILAEFEGRPMAPEIQGYGDVKYHLGYSRDCVAENGRTIHLSLAYNPSHLEAVDPVVEGIVRAKQNWTGDDTRERVVPLLIHGDASFAAQGVVSETFVLSGLEAYRTGGTIHVIIDNQVGFTTNPEEGRPTRYSTDIAKIVEAPVFHVNGDDPEAVVHVARLAMGYRQRFHRDVVIDLVCYRRYGHNELDDPTFTQPRMYEGIADHPSNSRTYAATLVERGEVTEEDVAGMREAFVREFDRAHEEAKVLEAQEIESLGGAWQGLQSGSLDGEADTAVPRATLEEIARALVRVPEGFTWHARLERLMEQRAAMVLEDGDIDWGCGEALAFGSLLVDGTKVRLSGQDTVRGTFSHRHAVYVDQATGEGYVPLDHVREDQNVFHVVNSPLSEVAVLGFEYGYSTADPWTLVAWEAQFGDFVNAAQVVIDQFLAAGEYKWRRMSGLVLLLPHGYEGQGPEHSSARLERFLELCAENNLQVANLTTPAQLFHALRRQMKRPFRKPLVIMTPKSLLRHPLAVSRLDDFTDGRFHPVIDEPEGLDRDNVRKLLVCSGKVFYTLLEARRDREIDDIAIARVEELYPFPDAEFSELLAGWPRLSRVTWVQEEPVNMGAWRNTRHRLERNLPEGVALDYVARAAAASPATGSLRVHREEEAGLIDAALAPEEM
ncbi:MAG TPA: 2-oxoglutarate dehydrogenase E1 component [Gemmatimonadota bacterium]|nr:2-oxoglutarate dehydrogenase E1 component [Gemmatimonadota bacterium]